MLQNTAVQWYQYFQDICSWKMLAISIALGGPGNIVQIDESVMVRAKYHRGHRLCAQQRWVFGVYDPEKGHIELVDNREAATLIPITQQVVVPGTTIWSTKWAAYRTLSQLGYTHQTVNHRRNFKDPVTGVCTKHVEAYWYSVKRRFKSLVGSNSCGASNLAPHRAWYGSIFSDTSPSATCLSCCDRTIAHSTKKPPALFRATHIFTKNMHRPMYGYVLSLVLRKMPTAVSVARYRLLIPSYSLLRQLQRA